MRFVVLLAILGNFFGTSLFASTPPFVIIPSHKVRGMFSVFDSIAGALHQYDKKIYSGVEVDFHDDGYYYSPEHGLNWWTYYCRPLVLGHKDGSPIQRLSCDACSHHAYFTELYLQKEQISALIKKYIHIRPHILEKVDQFAAENFSSVPVICVHYRGTDKILEAFPVAYSDVYKRIVDYVKSEDLKEYQVFVATDEAPFLAYLQHLLPGKVLHYSTLLSQDKQPLHTTTQNPYLHGEEALIDCLLLSKGIVLLRTESNLSRWSTYFNPQIPVIKMNRGFNSRLQRFIRPLPTATQTQEFIINKA